MNSEQLTEYSKQIETGYATRFDELIVYKKAKELAGLVFMFSKDFPREETYSLTDQIRRSSRSIGAQIAEAWAKRQYRKHFVSKLTDADGEQYETQHWIEIAYSCEYLRIEHRLLCTNSLKEIGKMIGSMIAKADKFCGPLE